MTPDDDDARPLVGEHPYVSAGREWKHPTPTADPQRVADLDRLRLAERAMADALEAGGPRLAASSDLGAMIAGHRARARELEAAIRALGGAASEHGPDDLPEPIERIADRIDPTDVADALTRDALAIAALARAVSGRLGAVPEAALVAGTLAGAEADADRLRRLA